MAYKGGSMKEKEVLPTRRKFMKISGVAAGAMAFGSLAKAPFLMARERFPGEKITFIVPYAAGGGYDLLARMLSPYLTKYLRELASISKGGDIVIRNEPAASGRKGRSLILNAKPNGSTIGIMDTSTITDSIIGEAEIDLTKFTFLQLASSTTKVIVGTTKGFGSWNDAASAMKKEPVKMAVGPFARANHVSAIIMNETMGTNLKLINFPGTAPSVNALIRGDVQTLIASEDSVKALVDAKEFKVLLVFNEVNKYPGAVAVRDLGFPQLADQMSSHRFIIAPPALEKEPKDLLIAALKKATADKDFLAWARKNEVPVTNNVYGGDAQKTFLKFKKFYEDIAPMLKKYLL
jgi:tripartite-type tricarboxylate transporter receptor subunit TctC